MPLQWIVVGSDPDRSPTQIKQLSVNNWNLRLAGLDENNSIALQIQITGKPAVRLGGAQLALLSAFPKVVAISGCAE